MVSWAVSIFVYPLTILATGQGNTPVENPSTAISWLVEVLKHPAVGNSFLLFASIIGVVGSYLLFRNRQRNKRQKLRRALAFEVKQMDKLEEAKNSLEGLSNPPPADRLSASKVPPAEAFPTTIYESNASEIGLLSEDELEAIVNFYTSMLRHKGIISALRDSPEEVPMPDHKEIVDNFPHMSEERRKLLQILGFDHLIDEQNDGKDLVY